ncbi:MAG TPA: diaminopimelate epimerase [Pyrinomonadaceae bacterium]|nr:diaminopimelate epimerase [Pyrinomonadaceae bacterium]
MRFIKFQGFGNDYIIFEAGEVARVASLNKLARSICDRHYGAGADGIVVINPSEETQEADFDARIFNADGSEAGLSGNGTRCAVAFLYHEGLWDREALRLSTRSGVKLYRLREELSRGHYWFESELGKPRFDSASIPMLTAEPEERVMDYPLMVEDERFLVTALQMGNPNCAIFVEEFGQVDWRRVGRLIESHSQFPERTNVEFVRVRDRANIELRIWERGVGATESSGTCSCAAVVASVIKGLTDRRVTAWMEGGHAEILWREDDEVVLTGRADIVYSGHWPHESAS